MENNTGIKKLKVIQIILIGDDNIGKTSLIHCYIDKFFTKNIPPKGLNILTEQIKIKDVYYSLHIYNTGKQQGTKPIFPNMMRSMDGIIICFDLSNHASFNNAKKEYTTIQKEHPQIKCVLAGLKSDLCNGEVSNYEAEVYAKQVGLKYIETSAKANINVDLLFQSIAKMTPTQHFLQKKETISLNDDSNEIISKKTCC